jgi:predicted SprT family Zn-dependent metalloprotease
MKVKKIKKLIGKYSAYWVHWTGLGYWHIKIVLRKGQKKHGEDFYIEGDCSADWRYMSATINLYPKSMRHLDRDAIEAIVIHELMHVFLEEMRTGGIDHEERVATALQKAFAWVKGAKPC